MLSKEQIKILCMDENFVQDFIRYETVREQNKMMRTAIADIKKLTPLGMPEYETDLRSAEANQLRLANMEKAHDNLLEDVYGVTWHCHDTAIEILSKEGRL